MAKTAREAIWEAAAAAAKDAATETKMTKMTKEAVVS